jgi:hypothetical protein
MKASYGPLSDTVLLRMPTKTLYSFTVYLDPKKTKPSVGETLAVDVMLYGGINFTQISADIDYDDNLLQYEGYENLLGWVTSCGLPPGKPDTIAVRSVPSMNMVVGTPCAPPVRIVTLKFKVLNAFIAPRAVTYMNFSLISVNAVAGYLGATISPDEPVKLILNK